MKKKKLTEMDVAREPIECIITVTIVMTSMRLWPSACWSALLERMTCLIINTLDITVATHRLIVDKVIAYDGMRTIDKFYHE